MKKEVKVQITLSDGYRERFTRACIKVAKRRVESGEKQAADREREAGSRQRASCKSRVGGSMRRAKNGGRSEQSASEVLKNKDILNRINSISL